MTSDQPRCHQHPTTRRRVTGAHLDDCPAPTVCHGCLPCPQPHCVICGRNHLTDTHPATCPSCVGSIRGDLQAIRRLCRSLRGQAVNAGGNGALAAAAPIPGSTAMVLIGPHAPDVLHGPHYTDDHPATDPEPPLLVLATWEDVWRDWLNQSTRQRATISRAVDYLDGHLTGIVQAIDEKALPDGRLEMPPDLRQFSGDIADLRTRLERVLHDERGSDRGVRCFDCGSPLVRRHRPPAPCRHATPAREWIATLASYGLPYTRDELTAALLPCGDCSQGGLDMPPGEDATPGVGWECPACRMRYDAGDYTRAVRNSLVQESDADGWTTLEHASIAAEVLAGRPIAADTIRKWTLHEPKKRTIRVASCCRWEAGKHHGQRLVFWPDIADLITAATRRRNRAA